ncbi:uncharacterized protein LOC135814229 [Sycon ciliatum]|uniref:uncharacterized protein LOC135814229 n=1 Tax=Sycon ciliatum TaxID=27933 RepID=UPI0031F6AF3B
MVLAVASSRRRMMNPRVAGIAMFLAAFLLLVSCGIVQCALNGGRQLADSAHLTIDRKDVLPTNFKLFGLNDVLGPVMQIPYDSSALVNAVESLRVGYLRHPGGAVANYWNITSGRYATTCSHSSLCGNMSAAVNKFPEGTFSPANFVKDLASRTGAKLPVFDLNVLTMDEGTWDMQINTLQPFCADVECFVEIGNELYLNKQYRWHFPDASTYMTQCKSLITKLRQRFPKVKISVPAGGIGSFIPKHLAADIGIAMTQEEIELAESWSVTLAQYQHLFDAVTIHDYASLGHSEHGDNITWTSSLATWPQIAYGEAVKFCKKLYRDNISVLITEYNEGLGDRTELDRDGGPHALNMLSHVLVGVEHGETIQSMQYHAFLSVDTMGWDLHSGMVRMKTFNATQVYVNGVSQLFAHLSSVAAQSQDMYRVNITGGPVTPSTLPEGLSGKSCLQAAAFSSVSQLNLAVINRCNEPVTWTLSEGADQQHRDSMGSLNVTTYNCGPTEAGGWVEMPSASAAFPWPAPLSSKTSSLQTLAPLSFSIVQMHVTPPIIEST